MIMMMSVWSRNLVRMFHTAVLRSSYYDVKIFLFQALPRFHIKIAILWMKRISSVCGLAMRLVLVTSGGFRTCVIVTAAVRFSYLISSCSYSSAYRSSTWNWRWDSSAARDRSRAGNSRPSSKVQLTKYCMRLPITAAAATTSTMMMMIIITIVIVSFLSHKAHFRAALISVS